MTICSQAAHPTDSWGGAANPRSSHHLLGVYVHVCVHMGEKVKIWQTMPLPVLLSPLYFINVLFVELSVGRDVLVWAFWAFHGHCIASFSSDIRHSQWDLKLLPTICPQKGRWLVPMKKVVFQTGLLYNLHLLQIDSKHLLSTFWDLQIDSEHLLITFWD